MSPFLARKVREFMYPRERELITALSASGWRVTYREEGVDWWATEIWTIKSAWTPVGFRLYLTWVVHDGFGVDEVEAWPVHPDDLAGDSGEAPTMALRYYGQEIGPFLAGLASLRDQHLHAKKR